MMNGDPFDLPYVPGEQAENASAGQENPYLERLLDTISVDGRYKKETGSPGSRMVELAGGPALALEMALVLELRALNVTLNDLLEHFQREAQ